jgi:hypothetical protein
MSKRFERITAKAEAWAVAAVVAFIAILYVISKMRG